MAKKKQNKPKRRGRRQTYKTTNKQLNPNRIHLRGIVEIKIHTTVVEYYKIKKIHTQREKKEETQQLGKELGQNAKKRTQNNTVVK